MTESSIGPSELLHNENSQDGQSSKDGNDIGPSFVCYESGLLDIVDQESPNIMLVEERGDAFAHEAGVYNKQTDSVYFTANFQSHDPVTLYRVDCKTFQVSEIEYPEVVQANGACQYKYGILYCSQGDRETPSGLVLVDPVTEQSSTLIDNFYGRAFNSINDVVVHHETGDIWFTDPSYGYHQGFKPKPELPCQVYRFDPKTSTVFCVADGYSMCNGLCFSPDYKTMYITDTGGAQAHNGVGDGHQLFFDKQGPATIYAYDVLNKKQLSNRRTFAYCSVGVPDGIKCDEQGNVYSGCGDGVHIWDPEGALLGKIYIGSEVANFCFAKDSMWIFAETKIYVTKLKSRGALVKLECE